MNIVLPNKIEELIQKIKGLPKIYKTTPKLLIVGGFVRDRLLKVPSKDLDVEVYGVDQDVLENLLEKMYGKNLSKYGKKFGVYSVNLNKLSLNVSLPRTEKSTGKKHTDFKIIINPNLSFTNTVKRRDFTINAIAYNPLTKKLIDPLSGQEDLKKNILRAVSPKTFKDDPLRLLRAVQFALRFKLNIEPKTKNLLKSMVKNDCLSYIPEQVLEKEMKKIFNSKSTKFGINLVKEIGVLKN